MRPLRPVLMVLGPVVVETTSTTMSPPHEPHLPPPPPLTSEVFFAQLLGSQRNTKQFQKNMEDFLRTIANNVQRGNNQGGGIGVNQYSSFKDFMDTRLPIFKEATEPLNAEE